MNQISGARFLITGGAGFVGSTIADQLLAAGASEIRIIDNFVRGTWGNVKHAMASGRVQVTEGDIRDVELVDRLTAGVDYVFHQAALRITRCAEAPREATEVLMTGTLNVLESAIKHKVKKIVAASSASVYGEPSYLPIDESHPFNNRTMYGAGKVANEQMYRAYFTTSGLHYIALRYFNVYGPRMDLTGVYTEVLIRWLDAIEAGKPPLIFGDGEQSMDFVFIDDVARANILSLQSDVTDEVFNVGTGVQTNLNQLCAALLKLTGSSLKPEYRPARAVANVTRRRAAIDKAEKMLGFRSTISLEDGLRRLIEWRNREARTVAAGAIA
ncbi:MAG TPA: NAD-dependent epimerase/dehydratase family protein [Terriglobales bacterium]|nr:NAD-dependent epimerase/dehydratase family protein [Terriglobales bacterium]